MWNGVVPKNETTWGEKDSKILATVGGKSNAMYIVLGKSGYIARAFVAELVRRGLSFVELSRTDVDYTNFDAFSGYLDAFSDYLHSLNQPKFY